MRKWFKHIALAGVLVAVFIQCKPKETEATTTESFTNPILSGFYPDPSITRAGDDYYMTTSTFSYFPGLPIFHSKDLVNWNQIGHAINRNDQIDFTGQGVSRGLFAPAIEHHDGTFYVICTQVDKLGNFIVTAADPSGPWSNPYPLPEVSGIDPSLFFDEETGKSWIVYNSEPPNNESLYSGHRSIKQIEFDPTTMETIGEPQIIVNGGVDLSKEPVWIEAPHLYKIGDYYYLMCAEGGTSWEHSEVIFRSKEATGPFEPWENNPILTQRHLDKNRPNAIEVTGHADMVQTPEGEWWAVFLGVRPYEYPHFNMGRETFLAPVTWTDDGWPVINPDFEDVQYNYPIPKTKQTTTAKVPLSGNFTLRDDFTKPLAINWTYLRNPQGPWHTTRKEGLLFQLSPETVEGKLYPHFIAKRQQYNHGSTEISLNFQPNKKEQAGLLIFQNEHHYYFICKELKNGTPVVSLHRSKGEEKEIVASKTITDPEATIQLKMEAKGKMLDFYFAEAEGEWQSLATQQDATILSTETAGGFVGVMQGPYATSNGQETENNATFQYFEMKVAEPIYSVKNENNE